MSRIKQNAEGCLVAVSAQLAMTTVQNENYSMWLNIIRMVLRDCDDCPEAMVPLRVAAEDLVAARNGLAKRNAVSRLGYEIQTYFTKAGGSRFEAWKLEKGQGA